MTRAGRGAAGLDATGRYLIVLVVKGTDGQGVLTADLAQIMIAIGAQNAVNFDGGGSTAFHWTPAAGAAPAVSAVAQGMIMNAKYPPGLTIQPAALAPTQTVNYEASNPPRPVYATLGFTFAPAGAKH